MTQPPVVLAGICGGIAAYKAAEVVSACVRLDMEIHVAMTPSAQKLVTPATFAALSRRRVLTAIFHDTSAAEGPALYSHLYPSTQADLFLLLPATANMIAKIAAGLADDVVSASVLALPETCRRLFCPAMNTHMWRNPVTQGNVRRLESMGWIRIGPAEGALACGAQGEGRMSEPADIVAAVQSALTPKSWADRRILILSGPTREYLDPVRFISNRSSGRMGRALALEAAARGAHVEFITGPISAEQEPRHPRVTVRRVVSAADLLAEARLRQAGCHAIIHAAAVADYRPRSVSAQKTAKTEGDATLEIESTPDVAAALARERAPGQVAVGFAMESDDARRKAEDKRVKKKFDLIVLNSPGSMDADTAEFSLLDAQGRWTDWGLLAKTDCARRICREIEQRWT